LDRLKTRDGGTTVEFQAIECVVERTASEQRGCEVSENFRGLRPYWVLGLEGGQAVYIFWVELRVFVDDVFAEERKNNVVNLGREGVPVRHVEVFG